MVVFYAFDLPLLLLGILRQKLQNIYITHPDIKSKELQQGQQTLHF